MIKKYFFILWLCLVFADVMPQNTEPVLIDFEIKKAKKSIDADWIKEITWLPIEYRSDAILNRIDKVVFARDRIYILDRRERTKKILFVTDRVGKIIGKIDHTGNGPGEYVTISDFAIDPVTGEIWIVDGMKSNLMIYTEEGDFISKPDTKSIDPISLIQFTPWSHDNIMVTVSEGYHEIDNKSRILEMDKDLKVIKRYYKPDKKYSMMYGSHYRLQKTEEGMSYLPEFSNSIFRINKSGMQLAYQISFDKPCIDPGTEVTSSDFPGVVFNRSFRESSNHLIFEVMYDGSPYYLFYHKQNNKGYVAQNPWNQSTNRGYLMNIEGFYGDHLVMEASNLDIHELMNYLDPGLKKVKNREALEKLDPLSETSNPILVFIELNK